MVSGLKIGDRVQASAKKVLGAAEAKKKYGNAWENTIFTGTVTSSTVGRSVLVRFDGDSTSKKISTRKLSRVGDAAHDTVNAAPAAAQNDDNPRRRTLRPRLEHEQLQQLRPP